MKSEPKAFASLSSGLLARKGAARPAMRPQGFGQSGNGLEDLGWNDMGYEASRPALTPVGDEDSEPQVSRSPLVGLTPLGSDSDEDQAPQISRDPLGGLSPASPVHHQQAEIVERLHHQDSDEAEECEEQAYEAYAERDEAEDETDDTLELADELPEAMPMRTPVLSLAPVVPLHPAAAVAEGLPEVSVASANEPEAQVEAATIVVPAVPKRSRSRQAEALKGKAAFTLRLDPSRHLKLRLACAVNAKSAQQLVTKALDELLASMPELDAMASKAPERGSRKG